MCRQTLPHDERLRSRGAVRRLFEKGRGGFVYPFRYVCYAEADPTPSCRVLFTVPKKMHKRANKRNLLRRRTKEAYRLNRAAFPESGLRAGSLDLALIYSSKEILDYSVIEHAVRTILKRLADQG